MFAATVKVHGVGCIPKTTYVSSLTPPSARAGISTLSTKLSMQVKWGAWF